MRNGCHLATRHAQVVYQVLPQDGIGRCFRDSIERPAQ